MSQKFDWTFGVALTDCMLLYYCFHANTVQTETAEFGVRMAMSLLPSVGALLSAVAV
jgi:glycoside/pentoside/hexuronide:cation symporter, GPH family